MVLSEGINNKIKLIEQNYFGYREYNFKARIIINIGFYKGEKRRQPSPIMDWPPNNKNSKSCNLK